MKNPSHIKNQKKNHPKAGSTITVEPIRDLKDIEAIKQYLESRPRDYLLFIMGINNGLRAGDLLQLRAGPYKNVREGDTIPIKEQNLKMINFYLKAAKVKINQRLLAMLIC